MTDDDHEDLAAAIHDAVRALPLQAGLRGVHDMPWGQVRAVMPIEAERYRMAADAAFRALGRRIPPKRAKALRDARGPRKRGSRKVSTADHRITPDGG